MMKKKKRISNKEIPPDLMSAEQLKTRFYEHFRDSGTFADLQAQLRSKLIHEMFKISSSSNSTDIKDENIKNGSLLPLQVSNWLVYDHLKRLSYEYSLSTFVSEANLPYPKSLLSIKDILHILGISAESLEYETLYSTYMETNNKSFLYSFLDMILNRHSPDDREQNSSTKMEQKESKDKMNHDQLPSSQYNPSQVFKNMSDTDHQYYQSEMHKTNMQLHQQLQLDKEKYEHEIHLLRQKLLAEFDALYSREQTVRAEVEQKRLKLTQEQDVFELQKEKLKAKELELSAKLQEVDLKVEEKVQHLKENLLQKKTELESKEVNFIEQKKRFEKEQIEMKTKDMQFEAFDVKFRQLQQSYGFLQDEYATLLSENERLKVDIKNMSDYTIIKEEFNWKSKKLEHLEKELILLKFQLQEEKMASLDTIQKLQQQLVLSKSTSYSIPQHTETIGTTSHINVNKSQNFEPEDNQRFKDVLTKIEDQKQDIRELHRLIHNLKYTPPQTREKSTSPIRNLQASTMVHSTESNTSAIQKNTDHTSKIPVVTEILSSVQNDTQKTLDALFTETETLEQKLSHYTATQSKLPNVYTSLKMLPQVYSQKSEFSKNLFSSNKSFLESNNFTRSFRDFDHEFGSKIGYSSYWNEPPKFSKHFNRPNYITQNPMYSIPSFISSQNLLYTSSDRPLLNQNPIYTSSSHATSIGNDKYTPQTSIATFSTRLASYEINKHSSQNLTPTNHITFPGIERSSPNRICTSSSDATSKGMDKHPLSSNLIYTSSHSIRPYISHVTTTDNLDDNYFKSKYISLSLQKTANVPETKNDTTIGQNLSFAGLEQNNDLQERSDLLGLKTHHEFQENNSPISSQTIKDVSHNPPSIQDMRKSLDVESFSSKHVILDKKQIFKIDQDPNVESFLQSVEELKFAKVSPKNNLQEDISVNHPSNNASLSFKNDDQLSREKLSEEINPENININPILPLYEDTPIDLDTMWKQQQRNSTDIIDSDKTDIIANELKTSELFENNDKIESHEKLDSTSDKHQISHSAIQELSQNSSKSQHSHHSYEELKKLAEQEPISHHSDIIQRSGSYSSKHISDTHSSISLVPDDEQKSDKNEASNTLDATKNTMSEMHSSELDEKGSNSSELSELALSAGSEVGKTKDDNSDKDDSW